MSPFQDLPTGLAWLALCLSTFLIGSVPFGVLIALFFHVKDLTEKGSGNIGATNVSRVLGFWPAGFLTFALDVLKGAAPILLVAFTGIYPWMLRRFAGAESGAMDLEAGPGLLWTIGLFAVLGHCYSPWMRFKGGKGVATGFGALLVLSPISAMVGIAGFAFTFFGTRIGSLSSLVGLTLTSVAYLVLNPIGAHVWAGAAIVLLILVRHQKNIQDLLGGQEKKF